MVTRIPKPPMENAAPAARKAATRVRKRVGQAARAAQSVPGEVQHAVSGTLGLHGERMSRVDTAWLRMDSEHNLMMIVGVWVLKPSIHVAALREKIESRLLKFRRFTQLVMEDATGASWVDDDDFDLERHVVRETLARDAQGRMVQALKDRVGALNMQKLDPMRPLWQMHLVEHYVDEKGEVGSALIARIHHCIADGIALMSVMRNLVDDGAEPSVRKPPEDHGPQDWISHTLIKPFTDLTVKAVGYGSEQMAKYLEHSMEAFSDPQKFLQSGLHAPLDLAKTAFHVASDAAALLMMPDDSHTRLKGRPIGIKKVAWCEPIPLDEVKAVGRALGASVNDVLLSCVAGAIGEYLRARGDDVAGKEIRAMVPVNLRPPGSAEQLGNYFGLAPLTLPIGIDNPVERVFEVRRRMGELKGGFQPLLALGVLTVAGLLTKPAQEALLHFFSKKATAVMTNVPGPLRKLKFCGATLEQTMFWVPQSGDVGMGVSVLSYGGGVQFGLVTDSALCDEPQQIIDAFEPEFAKLAWITLMLPWGE